jgi:hypothetical protein
MQSVRPSGALSEILDQLEASVEGERISVERIVEHLGHKSFASVMLVFALISLSPASAIPGLTATVAAVVFLLVVQMIAGRPAVWLPRFIMRRQLSAKALCKGISWLRAPLAFVERGLKPRLTFLFHRPWVWLPMLLTLALTLAMPFMEAIPTSGSIASAVIALFAAGLLTHDGALASISTVLLALTPMAVLHFGFG